jgi:hypothetical protein
MKDCCSIAIVLDNFVDFVNLWMKDGGSHTCVSDPERRDRDSDQNNSFYSEPYPSYSHLPSSIISHIASARDLANTTSLTSPPAQIS